MKIDSILVKKAIVIGIMIIFLGVGVQPAIAIVKSEENINCNSTNNSLFKAITNIANNPEVVNLIDEEKISDIKETKKLTDSKFIIELKEKIKNDDILSNKIKNIQGMIKDELYQISPSLDSPLIHIYILIILVSLIVILQALGILNFYTNDKFIVFVLIEIMLWNIYWEYFDDLID
jgi:uncharacterized membrane protein (DUF106 family)